jgi:hypothetical protein
MTFEKNIQETQVIFLSVIYKNRFPLCGMWYVCGPLKNVLWPVLKLNLNSKLNRVNKINFFYFFFVFVLCYVQLLS